VLLEGERIAFGASGRNGGFCAASLTHGIENGLARWPAEMDALERMGRENLDAIRATVERHGIDCGWEDSGALAVATAPHQVQWLGTEAQQMRRFGWEAEVLDADAVRAQVDSPTYLGGVFTPRESALVDPARLCWGLARAAEDAGATVSEGAPVTALRPDGAGVRADTTHGSVRARHALLATSAFPPLVRAIGRYVVAVYDYVLVTEPLSQAQRDAIGWRARQGISDMGNLFHYYRQTDDGRILWGGYDAIYAFRGGVAPARDQRRSSCSPSTSSRPSRSSKGCASRIAGAVRSTPVAASPHCGGARSAGGQRTSSASPAWVWALAASPRASGSSCSTGSTRSARGWRWSASARSRSRPSPCAGRRSS